MPRFSLFAPNEWTDRTTTETTKEPTTTRTTTSLLLPDERRPSNYDGREKHDDEMINDRIIDMKAYLLFDSCSFVVRWLVAGLTHTLHRVWLLTAGPRYLTSSSENETHLNHHDVCHQSRLCTPSSPSPSLIGNHHSSNSATTTQIWMNERKPTTGTAKPALTKSQPAIICLISNFQSQTDGWIQRKKGHWPLPLPHEECRERMLPFTHKIVETDPYSVDLVIRAQQCLGSHQMYRYYNESHFRHVSFNISNASSRITPNKFQNINTKSLRR